MSRSSAPLLAIITLGVLTAVGPFSIDAYLPGLPALADDFGASEQAAQLTLTACLMGLALGQLIVGPWSDRVGRRTPLIVGMVGYIAASIVCAAAPTIEVLIGGRFLQGLAGASGVVLARAVVRDVADGRRAIVLYAQLAMVSGVAPILAPVVGAAFLQSAGWRGIFWILAGVGAVSVVLTLAFLRESHPRALRSVGSFSVTVRAFGTVLQDRRFVLYALINALGAAVLFTYIASAPFVLQDTYGLSALEFAVVFGANGLGIIAASQVSASLARRFSPERVLWGALAAQAGGLVILAAAVLSPAFLGQAAVAAVLAGLFLTIVPFGFVTPNATALSMEDNATHAGTASALLGVSMFLAGAIVSPLSAFGEPQLTMVLVMTIALATSVVAVGFVQRRARRQLSQTVRTNAELDP